MEEWRNIKGYEGLYQVSNEGRIKSISRKCKKWNGERSIKEKIMYTLIKNNYSKVALFKNGIKKCYFVHRLVAETFIPNPDSKPCVDHINTNKADNRVENLRWCSQKENCNNPITKRKHKKTLPKLRKKVYQYTLDNKLVRNYDSILDTCKNGFNAGHVSACCRGKEQTHKGFKWSYKLFD